MLGASQYCQYISSHSNLKVIFIIIIIIIIIIIFLLLDFTIGYSPPSHTSFEFQPIDALV